MSNEYRDLAKVVKVIDDYHVVINRGADDGIEYDARFLIFGTGERLKDPDSGDDLGILELVRGKAKVVHVQQKISTLSSDEFSMIPGKKRVIKRQGGGIFALTNQPAVEEIVEGEERYRTEIDANVGDYARPI